MIQNSRGRFDQKVMKHVSLLMVSTFCLFIVVESIIVGLGSVISAVNIRRNRKTRVSPTTVTTV